MLALDEVGDLRGGLVVVRAMDDVFFALHQHLYLRLDDLLVGKGIVVVDYGDRALFGAAQQQLFERFRLGVVVKVLVLDEYLSYAVHGVDVAAIALHQDRLSLRRIVALDVGVRALELLARAADIVYAPDLGRAAGHPNVAGAQLAADVREHVVVDVAPLLVDERHRADFADEFDVELCHCYLS